METPPNFKHRYMLSPCGYEEGYFPADQLPAGWTDVTDLSEADVMREGMRRMEATYRAKRAAERELEAA